MLNLSQRLPSFTTHCGLYEFTCMPFGLCNAPATFQHLMQLVLSGLEWDFRFVYLDYIWIASILSHNHLLVLQRFRNAGLRLKPRKCQFLCKKLSYPGYIISEQGIEPDLVKLIRSRVFLDPVTQPMLEVL